MGKEALADFGRADELQSAIGLTPAVGVKIAAIVSFAGGIEYHLERALWRIRGDDPKGVRPDTDARLVTELISMLEVAARSQPKEVAQVLEAWCVAARSGFVIRNNIAHGVPMKVGSMLAYMRNPRWEGEERKREFGDFWADEHAVGIVREAMATLLRIIATLSKDGVHPSFVATPRVLRALREARSVLGEFASQDYNPSFEKY